MVAQHMLATKVDSEVRRSQRATLTKLAVVTVIASTGLAAGGTAGSLLGKELVGTDALAGLPLGMLVIGTGATALVISRQIGRRGWGQGLMSGYVVGAIGGLMVIGAAAIGSFAGLLLGSLMLGAANASVFLTRYAAASIADEPMRGRALGAIFFATAIGAVASPGLLGPGSALAYAVGLPPLSGLYMVAVAAFVTAALLLAAISHPAVPFLSRGATLLGPTTSAPMKRREIVSGLSATPARIALTVLAATNLVMVAIMAIAPLHMTHMMPTTPMQSLDLEVIGVVVSMHVAGMFAPAPITGWLADRLGPVVVVVAGLSLLTVAAVAGMLIGQQSIFTMGAMLIVLGVGWNCGVVGGSLMLASSAPLTLRAHVEGIGEVAMSLAAALGAPIAGVLAALGGMPLLSVIGATVALFTLIFVCHIIRVRRLIISQDASSI